MSLMTALLKTYEYCLENNLVDRHNGNETVLLPLFHTDKVAADRDIIRVSLDYEGNLLDAQFLPKGERIIFPITEDSVARSGRLPPAHPLVDKLVYFDPSETQKYEIYHQGLDELIEGVDDEKIESFLQAIQAFLKKDDVINQIINCLYRGLDYRRGLTVEYTEPGGDKVKKDQLKDAFLTFQIIEQETEETYNITKHQKLHQAHIRYVENQLKENGTCNISGKKQYITQKHRGLLGNAKVVSVSNHRETYMGRFSEGKEIIQIGYESSEKIHLMLKYLLDNPKTKQWMGSGQYLMNWFSQDFSNAIGLDLTNSVDIDDGFYGEYEIIKPVNQHNEKINSGFFRGQTKFNPNQDCYILLVDKASNGRISIKYFKELPASQLLENLTKWCEKYAWYFYDYDKKETKIKTPSIRQILNAAYGVEREGAGKYKRLVFGNSSFEKDQYLKIVTSILNGEKIPKNIEKQLQRNIRNRLNYTDTWNNLMFTALAVLEQEGELNPMIDENNTNRSYLFGRLLAIYERIEGATYSRDNRRITNAEKFWTAFTTTPGTIMMTLETKTAIYLQKLKSDDMKYGLAVKFQKRKQDIIQKLQENYSEDEWNKPLNYQFIFGYYGETQSLFQKKEVEEK